MSILIHRCDECGHSHHEHDQTVHKGRSCSFGWCPCSKVLAGVVSPPELVPTFDGETNKEQDRVIEPGQKIGSPFFNVRACSCSPCREAYDALMAGAS